MENQNETFAKRVKRESNGFGKLDPEFVRREKREQLGYLIKLTKKLGRPVTEKEYRELGNIL